jgi:hypothetical protein
VRQASQHTSTQSKIQITHVYHSQSKWTSLLNTLNYSSAWEVVVLWMRHSLICFMSQNSQCFLGCLSHGCLEHPPRCRSLDHLANAANTIGCRPLVDHHTNMPMVWSPMKQTQGFDQERGLAGTQRSEHGLQSPWEVANILTIIMGLCGHNIPTRWCTGILPCHQLHPCHLDKRR